MRIAHRHFPRYLGLLLLTAGSCVFTASGHDLFIRPANYQVRIEEPVKIIVSDGTYAESIYAVPASSVDRIEIRSPSSSTTQDTQTWQTVKPNSKLWRTSQKKSGPLAGVNLTHTSSFEILPQSEGSHLIGLSLREFRAAMTLEDFLKYLDSEVATEIDMSAFGFTDPKSIVRERFSKFAKTLLQVGEITTEHATKPLGLLVEIVPTTHPAKAKVGDELEFRLLEEGKPIASQSLIAGRKQGISESSPTPEIVLISDENGMVTLPISKSGVWWLKFIRINHAPKKDPMDFFSRWASLTFETQ